MPLFLLLLSLPTLLAVPFCRPVPPSSSHTQLLLLHQYTAHTYAFVFTNIYERGDTVEGALRC